MSTATSTVRRAKASDIAALTDLAAATFPLACPPTTPPEAIAEHIATKLNADVIGRWVADARYAVVVADAPDGPRLDGYALVVWGACGDPEAASALEAAGIVTDPIHELSKIYVRADAHGSGLAGALMEAAVSATRESHGPGPVWLGTNDANLRAQAFYRRHRFATLGSRTFVVGGNVETDVVMLRRD